MKNKPYSYFFTYKKICLLYAVKGLNKFIFLLYIYALYEYPVFWTTGFIIFPDEKWAAVVVAGIHVRKGAGRGRAGGSDGGGGVEPSQWQTMRTRVVLLRLTDIPARAVAAVQRMQVPVSSSLLLLLLLPYTGYRYRISYF